VREIIEELDVWLSVFWGALIYSFYPSPHPLQRARYHNPWKMQEILRWEFNTRHIDVKNRMQC
jgi:hypothetical protein